LDESNAIRAITIGVSTFIAIATISAVLMYYNTAKATVQEIGTGPDIYNNYATYIKDLLIKPNNSTISGTDAINIINYLYNDDLVTVNVSKIKLIDNKVLGEHNPINGINKVDNYKNNIKDINLIKPVQKIEINVSDDGLIISLIGV